ncbi:uncharacterized protein LOC108485001 [Gossypium arboreum]|uniref:uncharacterized protein LOC108485001 n=1 Tax=Gossypium arboreum TaxID=29729 RepID=UPI0008196842|nr:uncharacterized protein LOC108485001 [Gossypium arboreum]
MLFGSKVGDASKRTNEKEDIDFLEGDIQKNFVNGVPSITFSDRIHHILFQGMENIVVLKLLGRNIGFSVLQNKIYSMWKPSAPIHMMDIENDYFLVKFQNKQDCQKAHSEGPWIIFGQYLTVQPWTRAFDSAQAYPSVVKAWIRFLALPIYLYNRKVITEIGELVGKVVKLDMNTDSRSPGRFARMAVYVNLDKPLVSQVLINGRTQKVEYESLSTICFNCGRYGHVDNMCPFRNVESSTEKGNKSPEVSSENSKSAREESEKKDESYGPWMIVERKLRRRARDNGQKTARFCGKDKEGSCIAGHNNSNFMKENNEEDISAVRNSKGK